MQKLTLKEIQVDLCRKPLKDIEGTIKEQMQILKNRVKPGNRIAVAVGSRGIDNLAIIVEQVVKILKEWECEPFIVPAMGSHGGAVAEGQAAVLASYGITEEQVGVPIRSSMEIVELGEIKEPTVKVYMDKLAYESDGVLVINRVKAHTDFHGEHESGICKILVIGLGKHAQALACHAHLAHGLRESIPKVARKIIESGKILGALGIVEDGYDSTSEIRVTLGEGIMELDKELLRHSKEMMPRLPFDACDILLVDRMGKNISGTGMDTNVLGRLRIQGEADGKPNITTVCVFDMTPEGHGNALGIGLADLVPKRLVEKIDWDATYQNVLTSRFLQRGFLPIVCPNDKAVVGQAYACCGRTDVEDVKLAYIQDTLHPSHLFVSDALFEELKKKESIQLCSLNREIAFDNKGQICSPFQ